MPPTPSDSEFTDGEVSRGLSRRTMIKRAAAAGAVAWTAPMIIDSLASPAAAVTCVGTTLPASTTTSGSFVFTPGPTVTSVTVHLWGGGGSGGGREHPATELVNTFDSRKLYCVL